MCYLNDFDYLRRNRDEVCWQCNGKTTVEEVVCGWCEACVNHSSCDDTFTVVVPCPVCCGEDNDNDRQ